MAKRKRRKEQEEVTLTYKEIARARRESKVRRNTFMAVGAVAAVVVTILLFGIVNEMLIKPDQPVAIVDDMEISTAEFQEQVRLQRSQTIRVIDEYKDVFGVEQVYGIAAQLEEHEMIGEQVLDSMVQELLIRRGADELGVSVSEDKVWRQLELQEGYYRDGTPTPRPTLTPRPSPTPISPTETIATPIPSITPRPTPTVVTEEAFQDMYRSQIRMLKRDGVDEETYRQAVELQLLVQNVREKLVEELPAEMDQVMLEMLTFTNEEQAIEYLNRLNEGEAFTALYIEAQTDTEDSVNAISLPWTPSKELGERYGEAVAEEAFALEIGTPSEVIYNANEQPVILQVSGHEVQELSSSTLSAREESLYNEWLEGLKSSAQIELVDIWRGRVPKTPALDPMALVATPTSQSPE